MAMDNANGKLIIYDGTKATKQPRAILEEEDYSSTLSQIVTRDYFPSLPSLRRDAAILEARGRGDVAGAVAVRRMARREETEREREWKEEMEEDNAAVRGTELVPHVVGNDENNIQVRKRPRPLKHESITGFHARVTSEDNAEFEMNQERERREREERLGVVYAAKADKEGRLTIEAHLNKNNKRDAGEKQITLGKISRALCDTPLGLSSDLYDAPPSAGLRITDGSGTTGEKNIGSNGIGRNALFFQPQHHPGNNQTNCGSKKLLVTSGAPSGGTFLTLGNDLTSGDAPEEGNNVGSSDNLLMPPPPARHTPSSDMVEYQASNASSVTYSNESTLPSTDHRCQLVEYLPKSALPDIHPPATRFPYQNESRLLANNNSSSVASSRNRDSIGSIGSSYTDASDTTDLDASPPPLDLERAAHQKARRREHDTFVAMTPLIQPGGGSSNRSRGQSKAIEAEPIMTWGDVASTPLVLGSGSVVDGPNAPNADWEPTRPASFTGTEVEGAYAGPAFDVVDNNSRETMARKAEKGLTERAKTYRAAGSRNSRKNTKDKDDESVRSSQSISTTSTATFDRAASLTPAARALLEASNNAHLSKKRSASCTRSASSSRIFQPSPVTSHPSSVARIHAGSKDSFGSALRISYTPNTPHRSREGSRKRRSNSSSSLSRHVAGRATPRSRLQR